MTKKSAKKKKEGSLKSERSKSAAPERASIRKRSIMAENADFQRRPGTRSRKHWTSSDPIACA